MYKLAQWIKVALIATPRNGKIKQLVCAVQEASLLQLDEPPESLKQLILGSHPLSKHFIGNTRKYNTLFQMTSFGAKQVVEDNLMPKFKIQGQVYHGIGSFLYIYKCTEIWQ